VIGEISENAGSEQERNSVALNSSAPGCSASDTPARSTCEPQEGGFVVENAQVPRVANAGHQLFLDNPKVFVDAVLELLQKPNLVRKS